MRKTMVIQKNSLFPYARIPRAYVFFLCIGGALLNVAFNEVNSLIGFPLYIDTVFTVSLTLLAGPFWGALTGALTNIISNTIDLEYWGWTGYLFTICSVTTALITWLFVCIFPRELSLWRKTSSASFQDASVTTTASFPSRRLDAVMNRVIVLVLLSFALCLTMSILGGLLSTFIKFVLTLSDVSAHNPSSAKLSHTMFPQNFPIILGEILSRIPVNIIDRLITSFAGYGIALAGMAVPARFSAK